MYSTNQTCLSSDQKMMKCFGLDLDYAANNSESQIELHTKTCKRQNKISYILCYLANECTACGVNFPTHGEWKTHLKDSCLGKHLQQSGSGGDICFECKSCNSMKMNLAQAKEHILTFCALNFRSKCLMMMAREKLDCEIFDLNNCRHRLLAHLYSIHKNW